ncbi:MAG: tetratricopeptide repeat protein, partial [Hyphomicrobiales bacterium]
MHRFFRASLSLLKPLVLAATIAALGPVAAQAQAPQQSQQLQDLRERARAYYQARDYREALAFYQRALERVIAEFGPEHEQTAITYYSLGLVAEAAGDLVAAERYHRQSVAIRVKVYGPDSPGVAMALEALGQVLVKVGRLDDAEPLFHRSLKIRQDLIGAQHAFSAAGHANLGDVALARGNWSEALASYRQATRLITGQDASTTVVKALLEDEIKRYRESF